MTNAPITAHTDVVADGWHDAVRKSAESLVDLGVAAQTYPQGCVDAVITHGPYIVLAPGLALVHARPETGGLGVGVAATQLATPVESGHPSNDPVDLLIAFSSPDKEQLLEALTALGKALSGGLATLRGATSAEELAKHLQEALDG